MTNIMKYQKRISGPILDRIDIHITVPRVEYSKLTGDRFGESSAVIKKRVENARAIQRARFNDNKLLSNSDMRLAEIRTHCVVNAEGDRLLKHAIDQMNLSARGYHRVLKISRTIADLDGSEMIQTNHIAEALQYRPKNIGI
jgi:magnesium chelatase family protein